MPKTTAVIAVALVLLTSFAFAQLREITTGRSDLSGVTSVSQREPTPDHVPEPAIRVSATLSPINAAISPRTPNLERLTMNRFAQLTVQTHGGTIVAVETGNVIIFVSSPDGANLQGVTTPRESVVDGVFNLRAGDLLTIAPHSGYRLSNREMERVRLLVLTVPHFDRANESESAPPRSSLPHGVTRTEGVNGTVIEPDHGPFRLDMYQVASKEIDLSSLNPPNSSLLFVAAERLLATTEHSRMSETGDDARGMWIVIITEFMV